MSEPMIANLSAIDGFVLRRMQNAALGRWQHQQQELQQPLQLRQESSAGTTTTTPVVFSATASRTVLDDDVDINGVEKKEEILAVQQEHDEVAAVLQDSGNPTKTDCGRTTPPLVIRQPLPPAAGTTRPGTCQPHAGPHVGPRNWANRPVFKDILDDDFFGGSDEDDDDDDDNGDNFFTQSTTTTTMNRSPSNKGKMVIVTRSASPGRSSRSLSPCPSRRSNAPFAA